MPQMHAHTHLLPLGHFEYQSMIELKSVDRVDLHALHSCMSIVYHNVTI